MKTISINIMYLIRPDFQGNITPNGIVFHKHLTVGAFLLGACRK